MIKLIGREALLIVLCALYARSTLSVAPGAGPFAGAGIGLVMGLTFMAAYAVVVLATGRIPVRPRMLVVAAALAALFLPDRIGGAVAVALGLTILVGLLGFLVNHRGVRVDSALDALLAYGAGMVVVRWLLVPILQGNPAAAAVAYQVGLLYMSGRTAVRIFWPFSPEGTPQGTTLQRHPVPDFVVGRVEAAAGRSAQPFATNPDGTRNERAVSVTVPAAGAAAALDRVVRQLEGLPFDVSLGAEKHGQREVIVRPR